MSIPSGFPEMPAPQDNQFSLERWRLGKKLFFDKNLSKDGTVSCASCHDISTAFSDARRVSLGVENDQELVMLQLNKYRLSSLFY